MMAATSQRQVEVDRDRCLATEGCVHALPHLFQLGDDGVAHVIGTADGEDAFVQQIVAECPTGALHLVQSDDPSDSNSTASPHGHP